MDEETKRAALEAYAADTGLTYEQALVGFNVRETHALCWIRACGWMHEYATREAYERAAQLCDARALELDYRRGQADEFHPDRREGLWKAAERIRTLANESLGIKYAIVNPQWKCRIQDESSD